jgi:hypothetical protein
MKVSDKEDTTKEPTKNQKSGSTGGCLPNVYPSQQQFVFEELTLDSRFDSGNMHNAARVSESHVTFFINI